MVLYMRHTKTRTSRRHNSLTINFNLLFQVSVDFIRIQFSTNCNVLLQDFNLTRRNKQTRVHCKCIKRSAVLCKLIVFFTKLNVQTLQMFISCDKAIS